MTVESRTCMRTSDRRDFPSAEATLSRAIAAVTLAQVPTNSGRLGGLAVEQEQVVPEGLDFLDLIWRQEDECEAQTDSAFPDLGEKAPACLEEIGTVLSLTDRMASCWWGCGGGDHLIEYLCGRVETNTRAALRLVRFGFYDESLLLSRSIGEIANLFQLFVHDPDSLNVWKTSSQRWREFRPVKVRDRLVKLKTSPLVADKRYGLLSSRAAHVQPDTRPQSHNVLRIPTATAILQLEGILTCLNEIALPLSGSACFGALLLDLDAATKESIISSAKRLVEEIGGAQITEIDDYRKHVLEANSR